MKRLILITAMMITVLAGCDYELSNSREEATARHHSARAQMAYSVASEHLNVGQLDEACVKAQDALALQEDFHEARMLLAKVYIEQGRYKLACTELQMVREAMPDSAEVVYLLAVAQEKQGRLEEALDNYRLACALEDSNIHAAMAVGEVLATMGKLRQAQAHVESYLPQVEAEPGMYELAGRLAVMLGEHDKAATFYQEASDLDYKNVRYKESLGHALFHSGQYRQAVNTLSELVESPHYEPTALLYTMMGDCYMALKSPRNARDSYRSACELKADDPGLWSNLAKASLEMGDVSRALRASGEALQLRSDHLNAALIRGYAQLRDGRVSEAVKTLRNASADHPRDAMVRCLLGRSLAAAGRPGQARECYKTALWLEPDNQLARKLLNSSSAGEPSEIR